MNFDFQITGAEKKLESIEKNLINSNTNHVLMTSALEDLEFSK